MDMLLHMNYPLPNEPSTHRELRLRDMRNLVTINSDGTVDVRGDFHVFKDLAGSRSTQMSRLPIKFGKVDGTFGCNRVGLTTLIGCPDFVGGEFHGSSNKLSNLEGFPKRVGGFINLMFNELTSLEGLPEIVDKIWLQNNNLTSLKGCPRIVDSIEIGWPPITDLEGAPEEIRDGDFDINGNPHLKSLKGLPKQVEGEISAIGIPGLFTMEKWEGECHGFKFRWSDDFDPEDSMIPLPKSYDDPSPIQQVRQLFKSFEDFNDSLDYRYFKMVGDVPAIIAWRFKQALEEFDLPFPLNKLFYRNHGGYRDFGFYMYVDDEGNRVKDLEGVPPYNNDESEWETVETFG